MTDREKEDIADIVIRKMLEARQKWRMTYLTSTMFYLHYLTLN